MMKSKQIIDDVKTRFTELNFSVFYQDDIPEKMVGSYEGTTVFVIYFSDGTVDFEKLYENKGYQKFIKPNMNDAERFLIESSGVSFYYYMQRQLIQKLIPKVILALKNFYINNRKETIEYDFACKR